MARTRQIKPNYPFEKEIRALSLSARYLYLLSWCHMTDPNPKEKIIGGVLPYDLFYLASNIFPGENIDIAPIIEEIISQKRYFPFEAKGKHWLWCPTMPKHQHIQHPAKEFKYPDPPKELVEKYKNNGFLNEPSMSPHIPLTQSRVELSRVELNKRTQPYWAAFGDKTVENLKTVSKEFNIYQLLSRLKKLKGVEIPEAVINRICASYMRNRPGVKKPWPWFIVTVQREWEAWNAEKHERESEARRSEARAPVAPAIAQILAGMRLK